jgi:hypothetical protein
MLGGVSRMQPLIARPMVAQAACLWGCQASSLTSFQWSEDSKRDAHWPHRQAACAPFSPWNSEKRFKLGHRERGAKIGNRNTPLR